MPDMTAREMAFEEISKALQKCKHTSKEIPHGICLYCAADGSVAHARAATERMRNRCRNAAMNWEPKVGEWPADTDIAAGIAAAIRSLALEEE